MDKETQEYYETMLDFVQHPGFTLLREDLKSSFESINMVETIKDETDLRLRQGQMIVLARIYGLPDSISIAYNELMDEGEDDVANA